MKHHLRLLILALLLILGASFSTSQADEFNRAGLVIQFGDGTVVQSCVKFTESSITGYELLNSAGLAVYFEDYGGSNAAVCGLDTGNNSNGCEYPADDCWCECTDPNDCRYWAYHHLIDGAWQYSVDGASGWTIENGMVDGWGWGLGVIDNSGVAPPAIPFEQICLPDTPTPTVTPTETPTSTPTETPTLTPTATSTPTGTLTTTTTATTTTTVTVTGTQTATPTITTTPMPLAINQFALDSGLVAEGECSTLRWQVQGAETVFLREAQNNEQTVSSASALRVCPAITTIYSIRAVFGTEETMQSQTLDVRPATVTPTPRPNDTATPIPTPTPIPTQTPTPLIPTPTPTDTPTLTPIPPTSTAVAISTTTPVVTAAAQVIVAKPVQVLTPAPKPTPPPDPTRFLRYGAFALILAVLLAAGLWAVARQRAE